MPATMVNKAWRKRQATIMATWPASSRAFSKEMSIAPDCTSNSGA